MESKLLIIIDKLKTIEYRLSVIEDKLKERDPKNAKMSEVIENEEIVFQPQKNVFNYHNQISN